MIHGLPIVVHSYLGQCRPALGICADVDIVASNVSCHALVVHNDVFMLDPDSY